MNLTSLLLTALALTVVGCASLRAGDAAPDLPDSIADLAESETGFEILFEITGQQGADLSEKLLVARPRR